MTDDEMVILDELSGAGWVRLWGPDGPAVGAGLSPLARRRAIASLLREGRIERKAGDVEWIRAVDTDGVSRCSERLHQYDGEERSW